MKERPILLQGAMVHALLAGTKTQTRRVCKPAEAYGLSFVVEVPDPNERGQVYNGSHFGDEEGAVQFASPYGGRGDRLWVKETWRPRASLGSWDLDITYAADGEERTIRDGEFGQRDWVMPKAAARGNVSPLFMPRWASRITLEITGVRVERLQAISEADAIAEGIHKPVGSQFWHSNDLAHLWAAGGGLPGDTPQHAYRSLWEQINGPGSWDANPLVWVVEFRRVQP